MRSISCCLVHAFLVVAAVLPSRAQIISVGVKLGVPLTDTQTPYQIADGSSSAGEQRFTVGPTAELHFPLSFSIELDALWRQSSFSAIGAHIDYIVANVHEWQFPLLAKYELKLGPIRPFGDGGLVYRHVSTSGVNVVPPNNPNTLGVSVGGGVTLKLSRLRLSPEIRYTRWTIEPFSSNYSGPVQSTSNQADLLVGITF